MSETSDAAVTLVIPGYSCEPAPDLVLNGIKYRTRSVTYGEPLVTILVRELDEADQWDISEIAGSGNSDNLGWLSRLMAAVAVKDFNGVPLVNPLEKGNVSTHDKVRATLRKLGRYGVLAAVRAISDMAPIDTPNTTLDAAKNSLAALDSATA